MGEIENNVQAILNMAERISVQEDYKQAYNPQPYKYKGPKDSAGFRGSFADERYRYRNTPRDNPPRYVTDPDNTTTTTTRDLHTEGSRVLTTGTAQTI